jgi:hypothetical protein
MVFSIAAVNISLQLLTGHSWHFRPTDCKIRGKLGVTDSSQNSRFKVANPGRPLWLALNWNEGIRDTWVTFQWEVLQGLVIVWPQGPMYNSQPRRLTGYVLLA